MGMLDRLLSSLAAPGARLHAALNKPAEASPERGETAPTDQDFWDATAQYLGRMPNPDEQLVRPNVEDTSYQYPYGLFEECLDKDPHLYSVLKQRQLAVLGAPRGWKAFDDSPTAAECRALAEACIDNLPRFESSLGDLWFGVYYGTAIDEIIWDYIELTIDGQRRTVVAPVALLSRHPRRFTYSPEGELRLLTKDNMWVGEELPENKFLVFTPRKRYENPFGVPLAREVVWPCSFKRKLIKWSMQFAERFAAPTVVLKYPAGVSGGATASETEKASYRKISTSVLSNGSATIPETVELSLLEAQRYGTTNVYRELISMKNDEISKAVLGETMTTEAPEKGARSLGSVHENTLAKNLRADALALAECVSTQLVRMIIDFNFPPERRLYPALTVDTRHFEELAARMLRFLDASKLNIELSKKQVREECMLSEPEDEADTLKPAPPPSPFNLLGGKPESKDEEPPPGGAKEITKQASSPVSATGPELHFMARVTTPRGAAELIDNAELQSLYQEGIGATAELTARIPGLVREWILATAPADLGPVSPLLPWDEFKLPEDLRGELELRLNDDLTIAALLGREEVIGQAPAAAAKGRRAEPPGATKDAQWHRFLAAGDTDPRENPLIDALFGKQRIIPRRVLSVLNRKVHASLSWDTFYKLDALARASSFTAWDLLEADVRHIGGALQDAANWGYTSADFADYVFERLKPRYVEQGSELHAWHVETIYHTNMATAYNQAQADELWEMRDTFELFQVINPDPQYPRCVEASGKVYDIEMLRSVGVPPWHFGCGTTIASMMRQTADRLGLSVESAAPVNSPEIYSGPGGAGTPQPFGAWAPMEERYAHLASQRGEA